MSVSENTFDPEFVRCIVGLKKKKDKSDVLSKFR